MRAHLSCLTWACLIHGSSTYPFPHVPKSFAEVSTRIKTGLITTYIDAAEQISGGQTSGGPQPYNSLWSPDQKLKDKQNVRNNSYSPFRSQLVSYKIKGSATSPLHFSSYLSRLSSPDSKDENIMDNLMYGQLSSSPGRRSDELRSQALVDVSSTIGEPMWTSQGYYTSSTGYNEPESDSFLGGDQVAAQHQQFIKQKHFNSMLRYDRQATISLKVQTIGGESIFLATGNDDESVKPHFFYTGAAHRTPYKTAEFKIHFPSNYLKSIVGLKVDERIRMRPNQRHNYLVLTPIETVREMAPRWHIDRMSQKYAAALPIQPYEEEEKIPALPEQEKFTLPKKDITTLPVTEPVLLPFEEYEEIPARRIPMIRSRFVYSGDAHKSQKLASPPPPNYSTPLETQQPLSFGKSVEEEPQQKPPVPRNIDAHKQPPATIPDNITYTGNGHKNSAFQSPAPGNNTEVLTNSSPSHLSPISSSLGTPLLSLETQARPGEHRPVPTVVELEQSQEIPRSSYMYTGSAHKEGTLRSAKPGNYTEILANARPLEFTAPADKAPEPVLFDSHLESMPVPIRSNYRYTGLAHKEGILRTSTPGNYTEILANSSPIEFTAPKVDIPPAPIEKQSTLHKKQPDSEIPDAIIEPVPYGVRRSFMYTGSHKEVALPSPKPGNYTEILAKSNPIEFTDYVSRAEPSSSPIITIHQKIDDLTSPDPTNKPVPSVFRRSFMYTGSHKEITPRASRPGNYTEILAKSMPLEFTAPAARAETPPSPDQTTPDESIKPVTSVVRGKFMYTGSAHKEGILRTSTTPGNYTEILANSSPIEFTAPKVDIPPAPFERQSTLHKKKPDSKIPDSIIEPVPYGFRRSFMYTGSHKEVALPSPKPGNYTEILANASPMEFADYTSRAEPPASPIVTIHQIIEDPTSPDPTIKPVSSVVRGSFLYTGSHKVVTPRTSRPGNYTEILAKSIPLEFTAPAAIAETPPSPRVQTPTITQTAPERVTDTLTESTFVPIMSSYLYTGSAHKIGAIRSPKPGNYTEILATASPLTFTAPVASDEISSSPIQTTYQNVPDQASSEPNAIKVPSPFRGRFMYTGSAHKDGTLRAPKPGNYTEILAKADPLAFEVLQPNVQTPTLMQTAPDPVKDALTDSTSVSTTSSYWYTGSAHKTEAIRSPKPGNYTEILANASPLTFTAPEASAETPPLLIEKEATICQNIPNQTILKPSIKPEPNSFRGKFMYTGSAHKEGTLRSSKRGNYTEILSNAEPLKFSTLEPQVEVTQPPFETNILAQQKALFDTSMESLIRGSYMYTGSAHKNGELRNSKPGNYTDILNKASPLEFEYSETIVSTTVWPTKPKTEPNNQLAGKEVDLMMPVPKPSFMKAGFIYTGLAHKDAVLPNPKPGNYTDTLAKAVPIEFKVTDKSTTLLSKTHESLAVIDSTKEQISDFIRSSFMYTGVAHKDGVLRSPRPSNYTEVIANARPIEFELPAFNVSSTEKERREEAKRDAAKILRIESMNEEEDLFERNAMEHARLEKIEEERLAAELRADREKTRLAQLAKERLKAEKSASDRIRQQTQKAEVEHLRLQEVEKAAVQAQAKLERLLAEQVAVERAIAEMSRQGAALLEAEKALAKKLESEKLALDQTIIRKTREEAERVSAELERHKMLEAERTWAEENAAAEQAKLQRLEAERVAAEWARAEASREAERLAQEKYQLMKIESERQATEKAALDKAIKEAQEARKKAEQEELEKIKLQKFISEKLVSEMSAGEMVRRQRLEKERLAMLESRQRRLEELSTLKQSVSQDKIVPVAGIETGPMPLELSEFMSGRNKAAQREIQQQLDAERLAVGEADSLRQGSAGIAASKGTIIRPIKGVVTEAVASAERVRLQQERAAARRKLEDERAAVEQERIEFLRKQAEMAPTRNSIDSTARTNSDDETLKDGEEDFGKRAKNLILNIGRALGLPITKIKN